MKFIITLLCLFFATIAVGNKMLEPKELSVDVYRVGIYRHGYWAEDEKRFTHGARFNLGLQMFKYLDWDNKIHLMGTDSQIRHGGWEWELRLNVIKYIQPFYYHHSQHVMERGRNTGEYPLENFYGIKFNFLEIGPLK